MVVVVLMHQSSAAVASRLVAFGVRQGCSRRLTSKQSTALLRSPFTTAAATAAYAGTCRHSLGRTSRDQFVQTIALAMSSSPSGVPSIEQLSNDSFMEQISHSGSVVALIKECNQDTSADKKENLLKMIRAMMSHSDGVRGFFVAYLTDDSPDAPADNKDIPPVLLQAMQDSVQQRDDNDLIPLACMNVIMPTAMITMHTDPQQSEQSKLTAKRGTAVLKALLENSSHVPDIVDKVNDNCKAIKGVAQDAGDDTSDLHQYWTRFFAKWGYKDSQKQDIALAMDDILP